MYVTCNIIITILHIINKRLCITNSIPKTSHTAVLTRTARSCPRCKTNFFYIPTNKYLYRDTMPYLSTESDLSFSHKIELK